MSDMAWFTGQSLEDLTFHKSNMEVLRYEHKE
jgi:hypothetical protein